MHPHIGSYQHCGVIGSASRIFLFDVAAKVFFSCRCCVEPLQLFCPLPIMSPCRRKHARPTHTRPADGLIPGTEAWSVRSSVMSDLAEHARFSPPAPCVLLAADHVCEDDFCRARHCYASRGVAVSPFRRPPTNLSTTQHNTTLPPCRSDHVGDAPRLRQSVTLLRGGGHIVRHRDRLFRRGRSVCGREGEQQARNNGGNVESFVPAALLAENGHLIG